MTDLFARVQEWRRRLRGGEPVVVGPRDSYRSHVEAISPVHVEGWVLSEGTPALRVPFGVVLRGSERVLATGVADQFLHGLHASGGDDGAHAFVARLDPPLTPAELPLVEVRLPAGAVLPRSPGVRETFEPILHVAMDIVDNCNLRCPFCLYDYAGVHTTHFMSEATIDAALRLLPFTRDGEFWFSCLHEPTLHPSLTAFIDKVPGPLRRKLFYTTNLAKRMPQAYFEWFANNAMHHVNISIESLEPALYERMRKGARHPIFMANWDALLGAMAQGDTPPRLRYIAMVYKSNLRELPGLVRYLLEQRRAWQVELRYTYDVPHLPPGFREQEFPSRDEWFWLRDQLADYPADRVQLLIAPEPVVAIAEAAPPPPRPPSRFLPHRYLFRMSWDGDLRVVGIHADSRGNEGREGLLLHTNVRETGDPAAFLDDLARHAA